MNISLRSSPAPAAAVECRGDRGTHSGGVVAERMPERVRTDSRVVRLSDCLGPSDRCWYQGVLAFCKIFLVLVIALDADISASDDGRGGGGEPSSQKIERAEHGVENASPSDPPKYSASSGVGVIVDEFFWFRVCLRKRMYSSTTLGICAAYGAASGVFPPW